MSQHPTPAATVVLVREGMQRPEVLLLKRNENLVFNGGCWVFPGGRIDPEDYLEAGSSMEYPAACRAAVRETREEAGILIREDHLIHTAHWTTPDPGPSLDYPGSSPGRAGIRCAGNPPSHQGYPRGPSGFLYPAGTAGCHAQLTGAGFPAPVTVLQAV